MIREECDSLLSRHDSDPRLNALPEGIADRCMAGLHCAPLGVRDS
jgi:hypothetical protein